MTPIDAFLSRVAEVMASGKFKSEADWCREAGVSRSYIAAIRNRGPGGTGEIRGVKREQAVALAKAAGLDPEYLFGDDLQDERAKTLRTEGARIRPLDAAIEEFDWSPFDLTAPQAEEVISRARHEAGSAHDLPVGFWRTRLEKIAASVHDAAATKSRVRKATGGSK